VSHNSVAESRHGVRDGGFYFGDIVGKSPGMNRLFERLPLVAESESPVLISGASGTGKELVAQEIHRRGPRKEKPFVAVHCQAVPESILAVELFGQARGRPGRIARADGGTLFVDEVGYLSPRLQVKLLRFLGDGVYEPEGADASSRADVRVIAATNRNLDSLVNRGEFRRDLYYRLCVVELELPPLSERSEDIPLLARHFMKRLTVTTGKQIAEISTESLSALSRYPFPGNVRELFNIIERAFILCTGACIRPEHLPPDVYAASSSSLDALAAAEREAIVRALHRHDNNRTRAAKELGIHRSTLLRKMRRYGLY
jgi:DNA-binding NtrC family response regulator